MPPPWMLWPDITTTMPTSGRRSRNQVTGTCGKADLAFCTRQSAENALHASEAAAGQRQVQVITQMLSRMLRACGGEPLRQRHAEKSSRVSHSTKHLEAPASDWPVTVLANGNLHLEPRSRSGMNVLLICNHQQANVKALQKKKRRPLQRGFSGAHRFWGGDLIVHFQKMSRPEQNQQQGGTTIHRDCANLSGE